MADKKCGYVGSINHAGAQVVKAPVQTKTPQGKSSVTKGTDLRTGK